MSTVIGSSEAAIFGRLIHVEKSDLSDELAQYILQINFDSQDRDRVNELAAKARADALTDEERKELDRYNLVGDVLALWHSKARRSLTGSGRTTG